MLPAAAAASWVQGGIDDEGPAKAWIGDETGREVQDAMQETYPGSDASNLNGYLSQSLKWC